MRPGERDARRNDAGDDAQMSGPDRAPARQMDVLVASLYFDFLAGCAFFAAAAGDFAFFAAGFFAAEDVLLASA